MSLDGFSTGRMAEVDRNDLLQLATKLGCLRREHGDFLSPESLGLQQLGDTAYLGRNLLVVGVARVDEASLDAFVGHAVEELALTQWGLAPSS